MNFFTDIADDYAIFQKETYDFTQADRELHAQVCASEMYGYWIDREGRVVYGCVACDRTFVKMGLAIDGRHHWVNTDGSINAIVGTGGWTTVRIPLA